VSVVSTRKYVDASIHLHRLAFRFEQRENTLAVKSAAHKQQSRFLLHIRRRGHHDLMNILQRVKSGNRHKLPEPGVSWGQLGENKLAERRRFHAIEVDA